MKKLLLPILIAISLSGYSQGVTVVDFLNTNGVAYYPTHKDSLGKGGFRVVTTIAERNAITDLRRKVGMWVYVTDSLKVYRLANTGITNADWTEVIFSAGGSGSYNSNVGSGYRLAVPNTNNIKTVAPGLYLLSDSITNANTITTKVDTASMFPVLRGTIKQRFGVSGEDAQLNQNRDVNGNNYYFNQSFFSGWNTLVDDNVYSQMRLRMDNAGFGASVIELSNTATSEVGIFMQANDKSDTLTELQLYAIPNQSASSSKGFLNQTAIRLRKNDLIFKSGGTFRWVDLPTTSDTTYKAMVYRASDSTMKAMTYWPGGGGEVNTASNLAGEIGVFNSKVGVDLQFKSFFHNDFDSVGNIVYLDYVNGQKAGGEFDGFLSMGDWIYFDAKVDSIKRIPGVDSFYYKQYGTWHGIKDSPGAITVGTTTITSGTSGRVAYNNAGVYGEYPITGTGNVMLSASPTTTGTLTTGAISASDNITVTATSGSNLEVAIRNLDANGRAAFKMGNDGAALVGFFFVNGSTKTDYAGAGSVNFLQVNNAPMGFQTNNTQRMVITGGGNVGIGSSLTPTARLHIPAGTASASTAPLKFTSGALNTTAEAGAVEFLTDTYYGTITTGAARKSFAFLDAGQTFTSAVWNGTIVNQAYLGTGGGGATKFLREDNTWQTVSGSGDMILANAQTVTGAKTFNDTKLLLRNVANTFNGSFVNTNTADRIYTLKDAAGTLAFTSDITGTNSGTNTGDNTVSTSGAATTATKWLTARNVNGVSLDGTADITVTAAAGTLTGATLNSSVTASSLTSVGTLASPTLTTPVINGTITGTGQATAATASTIAMRDANGNLSTDNFLQGYTTTATAAGTTTLDVNSTYLQFFTGTLTQTVTLPVLSTLALGHQFFIKNNSTGLVTVNSSGGNAIVILAAGTRTIVTSIATTGTDATVWGSLYVGIGITSGKKLSVSNSITLAGTDAKTYTFPTTDATIARTDAAQTFTGVQTMTTPDFATGFTIGTAAASGKFPVGNGTNYIASTSTIPTSAGATANKVLLSDGTNYVLSTPTFPNASATSGKFIISDGTNWTASTPTHTTTTTLNKIVYGDGTNFVLSTPTLPLNAAPGSGKILIGDGTNYVLSTPTYPNASATSRKILVSDGTNFVASTETWAVPGTSGNLLQSDGTNWTSTTNTGGWTVLKVATSDFTTTNAALTDVTGLVSGTLTTATLYEFEAVLYVNSSTTAGITVGVNQSGTGSGQIGVFSGDATSAAATGVAIGSNALNTASAACVLVNGDGSVTIKGYVKTGSSGTPTISIKVGKVTSGTVKVYINSVLKIRLAGT